MERLEMLIEALDEMLDSKRKRHLAGGILISISLLFGGIACTVLTIKNEEIDDYE